MPGAASLQNTRLVLIPHVHIKANPINAPDFQRQHANLTNLQGGWLFLFGLFLSPHTVQVCPSDIIIYAYFSPKNNLWAH